MTPRSASPAGLPAEFFDGQTSRAHRVQLHIDGRELLITPAEGGPPRRVPLAGLAWPERQRHGPRLLPLPEGGSIVGHDGAAWDRWQQAQGLGDSAVVRWQQSWRATLAAAALLLALAGASWFWGLPWAARQTVAWLPPAVDQAIGEQALATLQAQGLFTDSQMTPAQQARIRAALARAVDAAYPAAERPTYQLRFHASRIGPNALALPGGTIVLTDALATMFADNEPVLVGVLAHELGHVRARHGLRALVQVSLLGALTGLAFGDFSSVVAGSAALLGQMAYARDAEREADGEAIHVLRAAGLDPAVMVQLFERLAEAQRGRTGPQLGIALASHPADEERMARFRAASAASPANSPR